MDSPMNYGTAMRPAITRQDSADEAAMQLQQSLSHSRSRHVHPVSSSSQGHQGQNPSQGQSQGQSSVRRVSSHSHSQSGSPTSRRLSQLHSQSQSISKSMHLSRSSSIGSSASNDSGTGSDDEREREGRRYMNRQQSHPALVRSDSTTSTGTGPHNRGVMIPIKLEPINLSGANTANTRASSSGLPRDKGVEGREKKVGASPTALATTAIASVSRKVSSSHTNQNVVNAENVPDNSQKRRSDGQGDAISMLNPPIKTPRVHVKKSRYKRKVYANNQALNDESGFDTNSISTSRYNMYNFFPKNLFEQFRHIGNFYFLVISCLQLVPELTPVNPFTSILPLVTILFLVAMKDGYEDYLRHQSDEKVNNKNASVVRGGEKIDIQWHDVKVGDICYIRNAEQLPGDLLLLSSSEPNGMAYIETSNLDGESNLKIMQALHVTRDFMDVSDISNFKATVEMETPNNHLYQFDGRIIVESAVFPISLKQILLRGCNLRNTEWVYGLVLNAGHETKIMQNALEVPSKQSRVERKLNGLVLQIFGWLFIVCVTSATGMGLWVEDLGSLHTYLRFSGTDPASVVAITGFITFLLLYNGMVPISLYVSIEFVKVIQAWHIEQDALMYDPRHDMTAKCRTSNLNEDLGQVEYVFCDKTGTLTQNKMEFKMCSIGGVVYGDYTHSTQLHHQQSQRRSATARTLPGAIVPSSSTEGVHAQNTAVSGSASGSLRPASPKPSRNTRNYSASGFYSANESGVSPRSRARSGRLESDLSSGHNHDGDAGDTIQTSPSTQPIVVAEYDGDNVTVAAVYPAQHEDDAETEESLMGVPSLASLDSLPEDRKSSFMSQGSTASLFSLLKPVSEDGFAMEDNPSFYDPRLVQALRNEGGIVGADHQDLVSHFIRCMVVCHTVIPTQDDDGGIVYEAASPDEGALLRAARDSLDHFFCDRSPNHVVVRSRGQNQIFQLLNVMEFNPSRKRMGVIVRTPEDKLVLYVKGADSVLFDRMRRDQPHLNATMRQMTTFATKGLRTLVFGCRVLDESEYVAWNGQWVQAMNEPEATRNAKLDAVAELIEQRLTLIGATAIEDKLQHGVKETMRVLMEAGIHVWILTGDKQETAINVGFSTQLLSDLNTLIIINGRTRESVYLQINQALAEYDLNNQDAESHIAVVIDGRSLDYALTRGHKSYGLFLKLIRRCRSVLCCRTSPLQKANVIKMVKENLHAQTLAIGDGANDVSMIQAADLGVGISGQEGLQAVLASDFAIAQFKFLARLILVHGQWSLKRTVELILYSFFKNMAFAMSQFWFQVLNGFSGQTLFDDWQISIYNLVFTSMPIMLLAIFDRELEDKTLLRNPKLYKESQLRKTLNAVTFWIWLLHGIWCSLVVFFIPAYTFNLPSTSDGQMVGLWVSGTVSFTVLLLTVNFKIVYMTNYFVWPSVVAIVSSVLVWFVYLIGYSAIIGSVASGSNQNMYFIVYRMFSTPTFWLVLLLATVLAMLPEVVVGMWQVLFNPTSAQKLKAAEVEGRKLFAGVERIGMEHDGSSTKLVQNKQVQIVMNGRDFRHTGYSFSQDAGGAAMLKAQHRKRVLPEDREFFAEDVGSSPALLNRHMTPPRPVHTSSAARSVSHSSRRGST